MAGLVHRLECKAHQLGPPVAAVHPYNPQFFVSVTTQSCDQLTVIESIAKQNLRSDCMHYFDLTCRLA